MRGCMADSNRDTGLDWGNAATMGSHSGREAVPLCTSACRTCKLYAQRYTVFVVDVIRSPNQLFYFLNDLAVAITSPDNVCLTQRDLQQHWNNPTVWRKSAIVKRLKMVSNAKFGSPAFFKTKTPNIHSGARIQISQISTPNWIL